MFGDLKEGTVQIAGSNLRYVTFGKGSKPLVIIPGLGDGLRTVKGTGLPMYLSFRQYTRDYRVYVMSRRDDLSPGFTTRDMAGELAEAMEKLHLQSAYVMGISQGGMISQWLAVDHPDKVDKLVIVVSMCRQNETVQQVVGSWIAMAEQEQYGELAVDTMEKTHTEKYLKRWRPFYWIVKRMGKPVSKERFLIQAKSCITHDAYRVLHNIKCPVLVIGGGADKIVGGAEVQQEMADAIADSRLVLYPELGHGAYAEAKDFNNQIMDFLSQK